MWNYFDIGFFRKHQRVILFLLNFPVIRAWFRRVMCIEEKRRIVNILPNSFTVMQGDEFVTDFRTHDKYSKRLYFAFLPLWKLFHAWDNLTRPIPSLNLGFDTLTVYPDGSPRVTSCDGRVWQTGVEDTWANIRGGAGSGSDVTETANYFCEFRSAIIATKKFSEMHRSIFLFDTSALTAGATISAAVMSLYGTAKGDDYGWAPTIDIFTSAPASNTTVANGDYDSLGTTSQTGGSSIAYSSWSTSGYNDFTLDSTGIGNISLTSITKFGAREALYDAPNNIPDSPSGGQECYMSGRYADYSGTSNDPKLVVTYTKKTGGSFFAFFNL